MSERLKTLLTFASLGLFVLAGVGCVRSFLPPTLRLKSDSGKLLFVCVWREETEFIRYATHYTGGEADFVRILVPWPQVQRRFLGFGYMSGTFDTFPYRAFIVPYWFVLAVTGAFPAVWWWKRRRVGARRREGQCPRCGYDLRATPGKCPECGWEG